MLRIVALLALLVIVACSGREDAPQEGVGEAAPADTVVADTAQVDTIMARDTASVP